MLPNRSRWSVFVFLAGPIVLFCVGVLLPIGQALFLSFFSWDGITDRTFVGLDNYRHMLLSDGIFRQALTNSFGYLAICVVIQLGAGLLVANLLLSLSRGRDLVKTLYLLPTVISTVAVAFLFQRIYSVTPTGMLNQVLQVIGLGRLQHAWLSDTSTVLAAVSFPEGWRFSGLYMVILYAALLAIPREIEEAALLDGVNAWQMLSRVRFPAIRPVWITCIIIAVTYGLRGFDIPYLLTNGGPGQSSELLTTYMYKSAFTSTDYGYASAISVFIVAECLVAVTLIGRLVGRRES